MSTSRGPDEDFDTPLFCFAWPFLMLPLVGRTGAGATLLALGAGFLACDAFTQVAGAAGLDGGPRPGKASACFVLGACRVEGTGARGP